MMVSGVGVLASSENQDAALRLAEFLVSEVGQQYFASRTYEYPVVQGVTTHPALVPLSEIDAPAIDLKDLADLEGTLDLLRDAGVL
jgi:iron(III) transport system substrate-binding protein